MQFQPQGKPSPGIVFDADLGNTIDDALALAKLFGLQGKNESRVLSVSTTKSSLEAAVFLAVVGLISTCEHGPVSGALPRAPSRAALQLQSKPMARSERLTTSY